MARVPMKDCPECYGVGVKGTGDICLGCLGEGLIPLDIKVNYVKQEKPVIHIGEHIKVSIDDSGGEEGKDETILMVALVKNGNVHVMETYSGKEAEEAYKKFNLLKGEENG